MVLRYPAGHELHRIQYTTRHGKAKLSSLVSKKMLPQHLGRDSKVLLRHRLVDN